MLQKKYSPNKLFSSKNRLLMDVSLNLVFMDMLGNLKM